MECSNDLFLKITGTIPHMIVEKRSSKDPFIRETFHLIVSLSIELNSNKARKIGELTEILLNYCWEQMHSTNWNDVDEWVRTAFELLSALHSLLVFRSGSTYDAIKIADLGILFGSCASSGPSHVSYLLFEVIETIQSAETYKKGVYIQYIFSHLLQYLKFYRSISFLSLCRS